MKESWYRIAFGGGDGERLVVAPGAHLGAAIGVAASRLGRSGAVWPIAAGPATPGEVPLGESVGKGVVVALEVPARIGGFRFPAGVVAELGAPGAGVRAPIVPGLTERTAEDALVLEVVAEGDDARERFLEIVERLPVVDNVEVQVADHHDGGGSTDVWLTPRLRDTRRALRFLDDFDIDLLQNGHVDVAAYVRAPRSTWRLTQHKTLVWMTVDATLHGRVRGWLEGAGLARRDSLTTVAAAPHHHYRPASSSPRARLETRLGKAGLRMVDRLAAG